MKGLFKKLFILLVLAAAVYVPLFSIQLLDEGELLAVENRETGRVIAVYNNKMNFVPWGTLFWEYRLCRFSDSRSLDFTVVIPIPPLQAMKSDHYSVKIPLRLNYRIDIAKLFDQDYCAEYGEKLDNYVKKQTDARLATELNQYLRPLYQPAKIESTINEIIGTVFQTCKEESAEQGIGIISFTKGGVPHVPDQAQFAEGLQFLAEIRQLEHKNAMAVMKLKNELALARFSDEDYYKKLGAISRLLKKNPDLIKYIYIDKLLGNVKVIIPSDLKDVVGNIGKGNFTSPDGDIDNLR